MEEAPNSGTREWTRAFNKYPSFRPCLTEPLKGTTSKGTRLGRMPLILLRIVPANLGRRLHELREYLHLGIHTLSSTVEEPERQPERRVPHECDCNVGAYSNFNYSILYPKTLF